MKCISKRFDESDWTNLLGEAHTNRVWCRKKWRLRTWQVSRPPLSSPAHNCILDDIDKPTCPSHWLQVCESTKKMTSNLEDQKFSSCNSKAEYGFWTFLNFHCHQVYYKSRCHTISGLQQFYTWAIVMANLCGELFQSKIWFWCSSNKSNILTSTLLNNHF